MTLNRLASLKRGARKSAAERGGMDELNRTFARIQILLTLTIAVDATTLGILIAKLYC